MSEELKRMALMRFLAANHDEYFGKVLELRTAISAWLAYIPATFPHYTSHTIDHSEEIVSQLSFLLFKGDDANDPVAALSPAEAYILCAAAFLHDSGMVVSDAEKKEILGSGTWREWISASRSREERWAAVAALRTATHPPDNTVRHFLADVQTRYLVSEFVRGAHHLRSIRFLAQHETELGRFAFGDPAMMRAITNVCLAHGLARTELEDSERFPDWVQIARHNVNVRFMALLLRLGDLLDMRSDRACPLLLNAACPLPADSLAHWSKYQRISNRLTAPDRVTLLAECMTHEEHRYLQDWCQWLVEEARDASVVMDRVSRHRGWTPPAIVMEGPAATITIRPAAEASYTPSRWVFELDPDMVFKRLVHDVYTAPLSFVRELVQNALDACRAQMYLDLKAQGVDTPDYPTEVPADFRARYHVAISLTRASVVNELSGESEERQVLAVDDDGIGMDDDVVRRYFLQVGRSFYTSEEFRRSFSFVPTSRFGVGFLSVFAVSDHVQVDTFKPSSRTSDGPLRMVLTGPRNYLLTEKSDRRRGGTRVEVRLKDLLAPGEVLKAVRHWCRHVEFPIEVVEHGSREVVERDKPEDFTCELPDVSEEGATFAIRAYPTNIRGVEGYFYVLAHLSERGESWAALDWATYSYPQQHPKALPPNLPPSLLSFHGMTLVSDYLPILRNVHLRVDVRRKEDLVDLRRERHRHPRHLGGELERLLDARLEEILREHLASTPRALGADAWRYKQRLVRYFPIQSFWSSLPEMIPLQIRGANAVWSLNDVVQCPVIVTLYWQPSAKERFKFFRKGGHEGPPVPQWLGEEPALAANHLESVCEEHGSALFGDRQPASLTVREDGYYEISWRKSEVSGVLPGLNRPVGIVAFATPFSIGATIHKTTNNVYEHILMNERSEFVQWLLAANDACRRGFYNLTPDQISRLVQLLLTPLSHQGHDIEKIEAYLKAWNEVPELGRHLPAPVHLLTRTRFELDGEAVESVVSPRAAARRDREQQV